MRPSSFMLVLTLAGCGASSPHTPAPSQHSDEAENQVEKERASKPKQEPIDPAQVPSKPAQEPIDPAQVPTTSGPTFGCRLPAPVSSEDACSKDTDCAPSTPCHARACVAVSKAVPRTPDIVCSLNIDCSSADVNPCSCYQGRCALVPKSP